MAVLEAGGQSELVNVVFKDLSNPDVGGWSLPGAVTFYESPVSFLRCRFEDNHSEDGLNLVRSTFSIRRSLFKNMFSDALDSDFSNGEVRDSAFEKCGNDGIDVSGSVVQLRNVSMVDIGDKGLSAGEDSRMNVSNFRIQRSEIAVASKDLSKVAIESMKVTDCKVGFAVYQKKPEFGPAEATVTGLVTKGLKMRNLVEKKSKLIVDGHSIAATTTKVENMLYGAEYGKGSQ